MKKAAQLAWALLACCSASCSGGSNGQPTSQPNRPPDRPAIRSASVTNPVQLDASPYSDPDKNPHKASCWELDYSRSFPSPFFASCPDTQNLTSIVIPLDLPSWTPVYARVKYQDSKGNWSAFSPPYVFGVLSLNGTILFTRSLHSYPPCPDEIWQLDSDLTQSLLADSAWSYSETYSSKALWSPSSMFFSYTGTDPSCLKSHIIADAGGSTLFQSASAQMTGESGWSPDGNTLAYSMYFDGIYTVTVGSPPSRILTSAWRTYDHSPAWSPDGTRIAFVHHEYGTQATIRVMNSDGSGILTIGTIRTSPDEDLQLGWLDNQQFLFRLHSSGVYLADIPSRTITQISSDEIVYDLRVSPDKSRAAWIYFLIGIRIADTATWQQQTLYTPAYNTNGIPFRLAFSPDSSKLGIWTDKAVLVADIATGLVLRALPVSNSGAPWGSIDWRP